MLVSKTNVVRTKEIIRKNQQVTDETDFPKHQIKRNYLRKRCIDTTSTKSARKIELGELLWRAPKRHFFFVSLDCILLKKLKSLKDKEEERTSEILRLFNFI